MGAFCIELIAIVNELITYRDIMKLNVINKSNTKFLCKKRHYFLEDGELYVVKYNYEKKNVSLILMMTEMLLGKY